MSAGDNNERDQFFLPDVLDQLRYILDWIVIAGDSECCATCRLEVLIRPSIEHAADEIERLRGLITKWADAEYEEHVVYGGPWTVRANEAYDALRKAVGR